MNDGERIRVIGVGSPFGDDALGLEAARLLAGRSAAGVDVVAADRPGERLLDLFEGCAAVIVIDAASRPGARSNAATVHDLDLDAAAASELRPLSSHGLGVAQAIALARALGRLPARGRLLAVEVDPDAGGTVGLSAAAGQALQDVCARAERWIASYSGSETEA